MKNTLCKKCFFSGLADSGSSCSFNIPEIIKNIHNISIEDNYNVIHNYECKYGFGKQTYEENVDKFINLNLTDYIKTQNIIKYSLVVIIKKNDDYSSLIQDLAGLSIKPTYITIICYNDGLRLQQQLISNNQIQIKYKIHNFLEDISPEQALHIAIETNKKNIGHNLWILTMDSLKICLDKDSIQDLNYLINVEQKPCHFYQSKNLNSNFDGIFINLYNYISLSKTKNYTLDFSLDGIIGENYD